MNLIDSCDRNNHTRGPLIVHCSAGLGRTGTFILVHSVLHKVLNDYNSNPSKEPEVAVAPALLAMRNQRPGLIQTEEQYLFCWEAIKDGVRPVVEDFEMRKSTNEPLTGNYASLTAVQNKLKESKGSHYQSFASVQNQGGKQSDHYQSFASINQNQK